MMIEHGALQEKQIVPWPQNAQGGGKLGGYTRENLVLMLLEKLGRLVRARLYESCLYIWS